MIFSKIHRPKETIMVPKLGASVTQAIDFCTMLPLPNLIMCSYISGVRLGLSLVLYIAHINAL